MRYFRYKNTNKNINIALKEQYKALTEDEKRTFRKQKALAKFGIVTFLVVYACCVLVGMCLLQFIPTPSNGALEILIIIGKVIGGFVWIFFVSSILSFGLTTPLWKKADTYNIPLIKKEIFSKACAHLRDYYKLQEPYIITKCFDATNPNFKNHDVCLFVVGDELRMTADLVQGFLHGERDLGCYVFKRDEIFLSKQQNGKQLILELKAGNEAFLLGYRAKSFIEKTLQQNKGTNTSR